MCRPKDGFNIELYKENGFYIYRNFYDDSTIKNIKANLEKLPAAINIPFSEQIWGYGNLIEHESFKEFSQQQKLTDILAKIHGGDFTINHLMIVNKVAWIGPDVEWHQEVANIDTYAPGVSRSDWEQFAQVFIAMDPQTLDNGCLKIIPHSHKLGFLRHEDCVNSHLNHKRRVVLEDLSLAYEKYGLQHLELNPGDAVFFNHLLIHGSGNNVSPFSRMAMLFQSRSASLQKNMEIFDKETEYRRNFVRAYLEKRISSLVKKNIYMDMNKSGKMNE